VLKRESLTDLNLYMSEWENAFGTNRFAPLPAGCPKHMYCPDYGPPLDYKDLNNTDGAVGGNLPFSEYVDPKSIKPPNPGESGWKDTADLAAGEIITIHVRWTPSDVALIANRSYAGKNLYEFDPTQGTYVWHCHVIDHEDNEMMRPYRVTK
jgi:spore coat protein A, manganese oxidase